MTGYDELVRQFKALGLRGPAPVMLHASLRQVGPVAGGADRLLDALFDAMGPSGTLVMALGADASVPFDALSTPADPDIGTLAEIFRRRSGTLVNDHAAFRWGAAGRLAGDLLEPMPLHDYHGPGSVLERFTEMGGRVLRLGADPDTVTLTHWAEYLVDVPDKRRIRLRYRRADIAQQWIESLDDSEGITDWADDEGNDYFSRILTDFLEAGRASVGPVGNCMAELFPAADFVDFAVAWMEARLA